MLYSLLFAQCCTSVIYPGYGVSGFHPFPVQTFFIWDHKKSLNVFYYACSYVKVDYSRFMNVTADMALNLILEKLSQQPVFLCIDDTIVPKFGKKFEDVSKLFDYAAHNGSNYLNGHCLVNIMLCVPVWNQNRIHYLSVLINIFGKRKVHTYVTSSEKISGNRRLFFSTVFPEQLQIFCAWQEKAPLNRQGVTVCSLSL